MSTQQTMVSIHYMNFNCNTNCQARYVCDTTDRTFARRAAYWHACDTLPVLCRVINDVTWLVPSGLADTSVRLGNSTRVG
jgi:hypothetical protein